MSKKCCNQGRKSLRRKFFDQKLAQNSLQGVIIAEAVRNRLARKDDLLGSINESIRQQMDLPPCPPVCPPVCLDVDVVEVDIVDVNPI